MPYSRISTDWKPTRFFFLLFVLLLASFFDTIEGDVPLSSVWFVSSSVVLSSFSFGSTTVADDAVAIFYVNECKDCLGMTRKERKRSAISAHTHWTCDLIIFCRTFSVFWIFFGLIWWLVLVSWHDTATRLNRVPQSFVCLLDGLTDDASKAWTWAGTRGFLRTVGVFSSVRTQ